tara:strand:- start:60 stop:485 length:426 start_codon:yes stop_codon:yes gene_type:complete
MSTPFKMKGSPMQRNFGIPSPAKHSGADYNAETKAETKSGKGLSGDTIKDHDDMHTTKWNPDHSDKTATKDTKASPAKKKTDPPKRETSWWKGEEGLIPDELQPNVKRPKVKIKNKFNKKFDKALKKSGGKMPSNSYQVSR